MDKRLWERLADARSARDSIAGWEKRLGVAFGALRHCLVQCPGERVSAYPCPETGLWLTVREALQGGFVAFPTGDDADWADDVRLEWDEVQAWVLDESALAGGVGDALGLERTPGAAEWSARGHGQIGRCVRDGQLRRVMLCLAGDAAGTADAARSAAVEGMGCLLVAKRHPGMRDLLAAWGVAEVPMAECLRLVDGRMAGDCGGACAVLRGGACGGVGAGVLSAVSERHRDVRVVKGEVSAGKNAGGVQRAAGRHSIRRGVNTWNVVFDGIELPGIGKDRGMFYVAYLAEHAGAEPMHALELEAKVAKYYSKDCAEAVVRDAKGGEEIAVDVDAVLQERDLNLDNDRMAALLKQEERKAIATLESRSASMAAKLDATRVVEAVRVYRMGRFGVNSSPANDAAKRVRTAIARLVDALQGMTYVSAEQGRALKGFAEFVEKHVRQASANLWPKTGLRQRGSGRKPGHFVCEKVPGIEWTVT